MTDETSKAERRYHRALQRLGTDDPACCRCGETYVHCLQQHHIAGRAFGEDLAILCSNCHIRATDDQKDHPAGLGGEPQLIERIGHFLLGLCDLLKLAAERLSEFGKCLLELAKNDRAGTTGVRS